MLPYFFPPPKQMMSGKVVLLGNSGVGKTSLLLRLTENSFSETYLTTIGVDFKCRYYTFPEYEKPLRLMIWDTAGQERFRSITSSYYRGADAILLVYDVTNRTSFHQLRRWISDVEKNIGSGPYLKVIVGTKTDAAGPESPREVHYDEGKSLADEYGAHFFEVSSKTGDSVDKLFRWVARTLIERWGESIFHSKAPPSALRIRSRCCP